MIAGVLMVMQAGAAFAVVSGTRTFNPSATVPAATGVSISAASVLTATNAWTVLSGATTALSFDTMAYNSTNGYWAPDHFFAIDVASTGGGADLTTTVTYTEGNNPDSVAGGRGLGYKGMATFMKATVVNGVTTETSIAALGKKKFIDLTSTTVTPAQVYGGWLRVYLGISTGAAGEPTGIETFTNTDRAGAYTGTIVFTSTAA
jgi:hypothetical protein